MSGLVPSVEWLLYSAVRKEALLTSQIEGTQATLTDLFDQEAGMELSNRDDVEEVRNYMRAFRMMRDNLRDIHGLPLSVRLICDAHQILLDGARGASKQPGELRRSQNWIGGSRPGNAVFVPPPPEQVPQLLADLERFIHAEPLPLPPLVTLALVHAQFETIHPFLDGNGRIGRLLITALLEHWSLLKEPLLYLSGYLKRNQTEYYRLLSATRTDGAWEAWVSFFLVGVTEAAAEAERSVVDVATLVTADRRRLLDSPKAGSAAFRLFELLPMMPRFTVERARQELATSFPTANAAVKLLTELGIVTEMTGQRKFRTSAIRTTSSSSHSSSKTPANIDVGRCDRPLPNSLRTSDFPGSRHCFRRATELAARGQGLPARLLAPNFACGEDRPWRSIMQALRCFCNVCNTPRRHHRWLAPFLLQ